MSVAMIAFVTSNECMMRDELKLQGSPSRVANLLGLADRAPGTHTSGLLIVQRACGQKPSLGGFRTSRAQNKHTFTYGSQGRLKDSAGYQVMH